MFRSLYIRAAAVVCSLIFIAPAAFAAFDTNAYHKARNLSGMDVSRPRVWIDQTCTDSFNVPNTTWATRTGLTNLTTVANWDTIVEAVNPDQNIGDSVQASGTADGWCDAQPWVIKGTFTMGASQTLWLGPFMNIPRGGFYMNYDFDAIVTNYGWVFAYTTGLNYGVNGVQFLGGNSGITTLGPVHVEVGPVNQANSVITTFENFFFPLRPMYLRLSTTGAGVFTFGLETLPIKPFYEENN